MTYVLIDMTALCNCIKCKVNMPLIVESPKNVDKFESIFYIIEYHPVGGEPLRPLAKGEVFL